MGYGKTPTKPTDVAVPPAVTDNSAQAANILGGAGVIPEYNQTDEDKKKAKVNKAKSGAKGLRIAPKKTTSSKVSTGTPTPATTGVNV